MHNMQWNWYTDISVNFQLPMEEQGGSDGEWMGDGGGQGEQMVEGFVGGDFCPETKIHSFISYQQRRVQNTDISVL